MNLSKTRILVVDSSTFARSLLRSILNVFQCTDVREAATGEEALDLIRDQIHPDMIITEYLLPDMDGTEMIRTIRAGEGIPNPYVPIIMLTAYSERRRIEEARDAGANEVLVKPFSAENLYRRIAAIANAPRPFVKAAEFSGPDRRRRDKSTFRGEDRRGKRGSKKDRGQGQSDAQSRQE